VNTTTWYVTQTPASSCESPRTPITVTINAAATAPTATAPAPYCQNTTAPALTATGSNLLWYTAPTGGTGSPTAPIPSTSAVNTTTWYVTQTPASSCESPRTPITVTINGKAAAPTAAPAGYCQNATPTPLTATGNNLLWYTTASGGTGTPTAPTPSTSTVGINIWYVTQTPASSCESQRTPITVAVSSNPDVQISPVDASVCVGGSVRLQALGATDYQWSPATGLSDAYISDPVALLQNDILYTVTGTTNGCSATAQVTLKVSSDCMGYYIPNAFTPNGDGQNDLFRVKTGDAPRSFSMIVFNRFGGKVFESANVNTGWNGFIGGTPAPAGAYVYTIMLTTSAGNIIKRQGTIMLVR